MSNAFAWSRDGREIVYWTFRGSFRVAADLSTPPEVFDSSSRVPAETTPDGRDLIFIDLTGVGRLGARSFSNDEHRVLVQEPSGVQNPALSPDGRWLAYALVDGSELVVRSWPDLGHRTVIAGPGATAPAWSREGREIFYFRKLTGSTGDTVKTMVARQFDPNTGRAIGEPLTIPLRRRTSRARNSPRG